jgi:hypothetical protein
MPHQLQANEGYVLLKLEGRIDDPRGEPLTPAERDLIIARRRLLIDFGAVEEFNPDVYFMADVTRRTEALGIRVAIHAPALATFGLNRQAILLSGAREGETVRVFRDFEEARTWLLSA